LGVNVNLNTPERYTFMSTRLRTLYVATAAAIVLIALTVYGRQQQVPAAHTVWEYKDSCNLKESEMNKLGADGWELVTSRSAGGTVTCLIYKRAK
jgi:hypothetical protein